MDFNKLLAKAFGITQDTKFSVSIYKGNFLVSAKEMTYFELGSKLISNAKNVKRVVIYLEKE